MNINFIAHFVFFFFYIQTDHLNQFIFRVLKTQTHPETAQETEGLN